jgi:hypothetical protein
MNNEKLFGFQLGKKTESKDTVRSPVAPEQNQTSIDVVSNAFGYSGSYVDIDGSTKSENALIEKYRQISMYSEVDKAITEIVSDAIIIDENKAPVSVMLDELNVSDNIKTKISDEFDYVLNLLHFNIKGSDIFKRWYIDGRINYHKLINEKNPRQGILELRYIDPKKIKKIRKIEKRKNVDANYVGIVSNKDITEFYMYNEKGVDNIAGNNQDRAGIPIAKDAIAHANSGLFDARNNMILSYLHKAIRPANQLRMLEDALVIYRLVRAPERRVFYVEVGGLNSGAAEQHITNVMNKHKNKIVYDVETGEVKDSRRHLSMTEDYWIPRRDGQGTEIDTLQSGQNLSQIEDVEYFRNKLYDSLNVPKSRFNEENQMFGGRSEISRDELKFARFVSMLRGRFNELFNDILGTQLALKGVMTISEWNKLKNDIHYDYIKDNYFSESVEAELLTNRLNILRDINDYVGRFFSEDWVMKNVLKMSEQEIDEQQKQIKKEGSDKEYEEGRDAAFGIREETESEVDNVIEVTTNESNTLSEEEKHFLKSMTKYLDTSNSAYPPEDDI